eukprot:337635-Rhodomonas_salina.1
MPRQDSTAAQATGRESEAAAGTGEPDGEQSREGGPSKANQASGAPRLGNVQRGRDGMQVSDALGFPIPVAPAAVPRELLTGRYAALWESADRPRAFLA